MKMEKIRIPQATKEGYIECEVGGVYDGSYPDSKTRRGRVQGGAASRQQLPATARDYEGLNRRFCGNTEPKNKNNYEE